MTADEVAKMADDFFDRNGKPIEKHQQPINSVSTNNSKPPTTASSPSFTPAFPAATDDDDEADVNFVRRGNGQGNRSRSKSRNFRSNSRPPFNNSSNSNSSSTAASSNSSSSSSNQHKPGTCRWHRRFGNKSTKCFSDCPLYQSFQAQQRQGAGNGQGGRRM